MNVKRIFTAALASAALAFSLNSAVANTWLKASGAAKTPMGHHQYCQRGGRHCGKQSVSAPAKMSSARWKRVQSINARVNAAIRPATDMQTRGVKEYWEVARKSGDCEDYALLKRNKLLGAVFKPSQLPLAKTRLRNGEAHVVLVLRTSEGDFALNNLTNKIAPVNRAGLRFLAMQSPNNASSWLRVAGYTKKPVSN